MLFATSRLKDAALAVAAMVPLFVAAIVLTLAVGRSDERGVETTATATVVPSATRALTPTTSGPNEQGYRLVRAVEAADFGGMVGFAMIPGASDEAVVLSQRGKIRRVSLSGGPAPTMLAMSQAS